MYKFWYRLLSIRTVIGAALAALVAVGLKKASASQRFLGVGAALGSISALLYVQPFLHYLAYNVGVCYSLGCDVRRLDLAYYVGYFTTNPLMTVPHQYGTSLSLLAPVVALFVALGFLAVLSYSAAIIGSDLTSFAWKVGVLGGAELTTLGLVFSVWSDRWGGSIALPVAILSLMTYSLLAYSFSPELAVKGLEIARGHSGLGITSVAVGLSSVLLLPAIFWGNRYQFGGAIIFGFMFVGILAGIELAIAGLLQRNRKRVFPILGLVINVLLLLGGPLLVMWLAFRDLQVD